MSYLLFSLPIPIINIRIYQFVAIIHSGFPVFSSSKLKNLASNCKTKRWVGSMGPTHFWFNVFRTNQHTGGTRKVRRVGPIMLGPKKYDFHSHSGQTNMAFGEPTSKEDRILANPTTWEINRDICSMDPQLSKSKQTISIQG